MNAGARRCGDAREVKTVWLALGPALNAGPARNARIWSRQSRLTGLVIFSRKYIFRDEIRSREQLENRGTKAATRDDNT